MSKETINENYEQLRSLYVHSRQTTKALENLLNKFGYEEDENLHIAIGDARNVMNVLTHRTASILGLAE